MASGPWTTRRGASAVLAALMTAAGSAVSACEKPLYLSFDTGHMEVAPLIAEVLQRHGVRVTFFAANERSKSGDGSLGRDWAPWWKERAREGHEFASHTMDHMVWQADLPGEPARFRVKPTSGPRQGQSFELTGQEYCEQIRQAATTLEAFTGKPALPLFRAPGGRTSARLLATARGCGFEHVGWADAGFLGDELPSERYSNAHLLAQALKNIRSGDILLAHLGIWSRRDPWAPAVLEPLIQGLKAKGFCFSTLAEHPAYRDWLARHKR